MKVQICKSVTTDIETEVDVSINDILNEFSRRMAIEEMNDDRWNQDIYLQLVCFAVALMEMIPEAGIAKFHDLLRGRLANQLNEQAERWAATSTADER